MEKDDFGYGVDESRKAIVGYLQMFEFFGTVPETLEVGNLNLSFDSMTSTIQTIDSCLLVFILHDTYLHVKPKEWEQFDASLKLITPILIKTINEEFHSNPNYIEKLCNAYVKALDNRLSYIYNNLSQNEISQNSGFNDLLWNVKDIISEIAFYTPMLDPVNGFLNEDAKQIAMHLVKPDLKRSKTAPANPDRIKALKELAPELWGRLLKSQDTSIQKKAVHLITGTNIEDSKKYSFGSRAHQVDSREVEGLTELINTLN